ncbi:MAG TPA: OsmC family protein [Gaiellaceae bacterium]|jgi:organic hydroperoxide reductase OsmC/OhrA
MTARRFEYHVEERFGDPPHVEPDWTPEHFVLAGLARCTFKSLDFHAKRRGISVSGTAAAQGLVTKRDEDGRYAFVDVDCRLEIELDPPPYRQALEELLDLAERDCFVGASLNPTPHYEWQVGGKSVR